MESLVALLDRGACEPCAVACGIDAERRASDNAGLGHLARHQRGMRGAPADGS